MPTSAEKLSDAYYPMLVFAAGSSQEAQLQMWDKFRTLDPGKKAILVSTEVADRLQDFEKRFQLQEVGVAVVSFAIRKMFFGELDARAAEEKIASALTSSGGGDPVHARAIVEAIQNEVMVIVPAPEPVIVEETVASRPIGPTVRMPLLKAMSEYKHLSEQMLTEEKVKLKGSMEPVRPSLGNWLKSYREELGIGLHDPTQRGSFLFQSQNGKHLSNEDRARMNLVLKSIEEGFPLEIDPVRQVIVFPNTGDASMELAQVKTRPMSRIIRPRGLPDSTALAPASTMPRLPQVAPVKSSPLESFKPLFAKSAAPEKNVSGETLHFSTGHVLPAEREASGSGTDGNEALRQMQHPTSSIKREIKAPLTKSPYSIRPLRSRANGDTSA
jgi:hypothetical protein